MSMNEKKRPVGISDFKTIIEGSYYYVDKSLFIKEILDKGDKVLQVHRSRRFGKSLNLYMLRYFFDCCPGGAIGAGDGFFAYRLFVAHRFFPGRRKNIG